MVHFDFLRPKNAHFSSTWEPTPPASPQPIFLDEDHRRRRTDVPYLLPKDLQEVNRLDYQHYIFRRILQGNCFAPVHDLLQQGGAVLDVGCGTGRWCNTIAIAYPRSQVTGFDLEPVVPTKPLPSNTRIVQGNLFHGLPFPEDHFHYVHQRLMVAAIPLDRWPWVINELKRVTAPGGFIELVEMGASFSRPGPATERFLSWWTVIRASRRIDASKMSELDLLLTQAQLTQVQKKVVTVPVGSWGGTLGTMLAQNILAGWPSMRPLVHTLLGIAPQRFDAVLEQLTTEWNTSRTTYDVYFYSAQVKKDRNTPITYSPEGRISHVSTPVV